MPELRRRPAPRSTTAKRLGGPAIGDEAAVEPGVRQLVEDDAVGRRVGDLDPAVRRVEQARRSRPCDRTSASCDGERPFDRPGDADLALQDRQRPLDQRRDAVAPRRVVRPGPEQDRRAGRPASGTSSDVSAYVGRPVGGDVRDEVERRRRAVRSTSARGRVRRRRARQRAAPIVDAVAGREADVDRRARASPASRTAQAAKDTSECEIRTGRSGAPPGSMMSKVSVSVVDLPGGEVRPEVELEVRVVVGLLS